eukprot:4914688-Prymnesium_polylepis.5
MGGFCAVKSKIQTDCSYTLLRRSASSNAPRNPPYATPVGSNTHARSAQDWDKEPRRSRFASKWSQATGCVLTMHGVEEALYALHEHESVGTICIQPVGKQDEGVQLEPLSLSSCLRLLVVHKDDVEANEEARIFCAPGAADEGLRRGRVREARRNTRMRHVCGRGRNLPIFPVGTSGTTTCNALQRVPLNRPDFLNLRRLLKLRTSALNLHNESHMKLRAWARVPKAHQDCGMFTLASCAESVVPPPLTIMNRTSDANICSTFNAFPQMAQ